MRQIPRQLQLNFQTRGPTAVSVTANFATERNAAKKWEIG